MLVAFVAFQEGEPVPAIAYVDADEVAAVRVWRPGSLATAVTEITLVNGERIKVCQDAEIAQNRLSARRRRRRRK